MVMWRLMTVRGSSCLCVDLWDAQRRNVVTSVLSRTKPSCIHKVHQQTPPWMLLVMVRSSHVVGSSDVFTFHKQGVYQQTPP
ncbi:hypothetical protein HanRHA438_Chr16g0740361 [Helianthus annuus]|nr:hypothetical protein HanRHA438_Chr16g0740361 [Helianthus annuus]